MNFEGGDGGDWRGMGSGLLGMRVESNGLPFCRVRPFVLDP